VVIIEAEHQIEGLDEEHGCNGPINGEHPVDQGVAVEQRLRLRCRNPRDVRSRVRPPNARKHRRTPKYVAERAGLDDEDPNA
jgi:hypothetical protein